MAENNFEKLITKRKEWVQSSKENNFDFDSILAGIYNDPSHFIYEILQNAEDANASKISFNLYEDRLEIIHNGKDFDIDDVDGITGIGISTKKDDINSIGDFGVGFKSVFAITKTPVIHSGKFHFEIKDFVVPSLIDSNGIKETLIILPFNHPSRPKEEVFEIVSKKLESLGLKTLLFLKNIQEIKWKTPGKSGHYYKEVSNFKNLENVQRTSVISKTGEDESFEEFLVIKKPIMIETHNLSVEIAYRIKTAKTGTEIIEKEKDSKLIVFFPTEKVTYLNFLIQGPYKTTPNRENIPLDDDQNRYLIEETANLVADSIPIIKKLGFLNVSFLEVLPIDRNHTDEIIYSTIFKKVKEKLSSDEALLPTSKKGFTTAQNALLARGKELVELLNENDINILFGKTNWLDTNITYDRTRQLRNYLINVLDIKEIDFEDFAKSVTKKFIESKSDGWLIDFYGCLLDQRSLWAKTGYSNPRAGVLLEKPIIRLDDNSHIAPCDGSGKIQVYLPIETKSQYKTVKKVLTQNEKSLKFLQELGLSKPDIFAEIKEFIIPKYRHPNPDVSFDEYFEDFEKLLIAFQKESSDKKKEMLSELKSLHIIYSINSISSENYFCRPSKTYLNTDELIEYFKGFDHVFFISNELNQRFKDINNVLIDFLLTLGCEDKPRRIQVEPSLSYEDKMKLQDNGWTTREIRTIDYDYEGLDNFFKNITKERSFLLWKFLLQSLTFYDKWPKIDFFRGEYSWFYYRENTQKYDAKFLKTLKNTAWLVDKNGNFRKPSKITFSELSDNYKKEGSNIEILVKVLAFKSEIIEQLPEAEKEILKIAKEENITPEKLKSLISESKRKSSNEKEKTWSPECKPNIITPQIQEIEPDKINIPDLSNQIKSGKTKKPEKQVENIEKPQEVDKGLINKKAIGKWGEEYVFSALRKKYQNQGKIIETDWGFKIITCNDDEFEIIWFNKGEDIGKGYDFCIKKNGNEVEYIEVKSKTQENPELIEIQGTQWEFARKLYNENEGDKYKIYVVSDAGTKRAKIRIIKNPAKLWKDGKLYAHPIHFKL